MKPTSQIVKQLGEAYRVMAAHDYRPEARSDGFGNIEDFDALDIDAEIARYVERWWREEDNTGLYLIGFPNLNERRALVYLIEAARCISAGATDWSLMLTRLAVAEFESLIRDPEERPGNVFGPRCRDDLAKVEKAA